MMGGTMPGHMFVLAPGKTGLCMACNLRLIASCWLPLVKCHMLWCCWPTAQGFDLDRNILTQWMNGNLLLLMHMHFCTRLFIGMWRTHCCILAAHTGTSDQMMKYNHVLSAVICWLVWQRCTQKLPPVHSQLNRQLSWLFQVLVLLGPSFKCQYPLVMSKWAWGLRWELGCPGEALVVLLEFLAHSQEGGVAMEGVTCPWVAGVTLAEATLTWMLLKISVVYWTMAICSCVCMPRCVMKAKFVLHVMSLADFLVF